MRKEINGGKIVTPAPIGVLDDRKPFNLPVSIAKMKFVEACLHNVYEVGGGLWGLLCL
jgi:hypothetical protein